MVKSWQNTNFEYKITVIPLYQNDGYSLAERVGFEPTVGCPITSFQDWLLKPLGHLSNFKNYTTEPAKSQVSAL